MKETEDRLLPSDEHYIRRILGLDPYNAMMDEPEDAEEEEITGDSNGKLRIVICMPKAGSRRLQTSGRYIQCDIAYKRVVGFYEFEVACMDRDANTSKCQDCCTLFLPLIQWIQV